MLKLSRVFPRDCGTLRPTPKRQKALDMIRVSLDHPWPLLISEAASNVLNPDQAECEEIAHFGADPQKPGLSHTVSD
jgi:hypothetical protein